MKSKTKKKENFYKKHTLLTKTTTIKEKNTIITQIKKKTKETIKPI